ncbi:MAG: hypothetical protein HY719_16355 [Planctomycetes bacterium]|nr:hypothetical protein [Planctomycetota bacterium]
MGQEAGVAGRLAVKSAARAAVATVGVLWSLLFQAGTGFGMDVVEDQNGHFWEGTKNEEKSTALELCLDLAKGQGPSQKVFPEGKYRVFRPGKSMDDVYNERAALVKPDDAEGHYALGKWCREHKKRLEKQADAEFAKTLALSPDHAGARAALGYVRRGPKWVKVVQDQVNFADAAFEWRDRLQEIPQADWHVRAITHHAGSTSPSSVNLANDRAVWIEVRKEGAREMYGMISYNFASRASQYLLPSSPTELRYARLAGVKLAYLVGGKQVDDPKKPGAKQWICHNLVVRDILKSQSDGSVKVTDNQSTYCDAPLISNTHLLWRHLTALVLPGKKPPPQPVYAGALADLKALTVKDKRLDLTGDNLSFDFARRATLEGSRVYWVHEKGISSFDVTKRREEAIIDDEKIATDPPSVEGDALCYTSRGRQATIVYNLTSRKEKRLKVWLKDAKYHNGYVVGVEGNGEESQIVLYHVASDTSTVIQRGGGPEKPLLAGVCIVWRQYNPKTKCRDVWAATPRVTGVPAEGKEEPVGAAPATPPAAPPATPPAVPSGAGAGAGAGAKPGAPAEGEGGPRDGKATETTKPPAAADSGEKQAAADPGAGPGEAERQAAAGD